jgi:plastocyanin
MYVQRIILPSALLLLAGCQTIGGEGMPTLTRTGEVKDVVISEGVEPTSLTVSPGDEIRWINKRQGVVRVIFLSPMTAMSTRPDCVPIKQRACVSGRPAR